MHQHTPSLRDLLPTAFAPLVWGSTYLVTTQTLPSDRPLTAALLRCLPAGLLLLVFFRGWPGWRWLGRCAVLSVLNIGLFQALLFIGAYRLPGGVAATLGAIQPLLVLTLAWPLLSIRPTLTAAVAGLAGMAGVGLLVLTPAARLDGVGIAASLGGAVCMALGFVLTKRWKPEGPLLRFTAWQLTLGGLQLLPVALLAEPPLPPLSLLNLAGYAYLGLIGTAVAYALWFRGLHRLPPSAAASLGLLSPVSATVLGWVMLGQAFSPGQSLGAALVLAAVWMGQKSRG
ncbi:MAG TPA: EamA family transporter [Candidatus Sulfotelmatobacter sp.]|jgi:probable blue pigment (indigoidine) exporter|nr:EamA family transporter [Candidatus Sulfotelmatobacter sp.]